MKNKLLIACSLSFVLLAGCSNSNPSATSLTTSEEKVSFANWNDCDSLTVLKNYVAKVTKEGASDYIEKADRVAVFDMDGTLYGELYPTYLEYVMYQYRVLEDPEYKDKATEEQILLANEIKAGVMNDKEGNPVNTAGNSYPSGTDLRHAKLAAQVYAGMTLSEFDVYCKNFLAKPVVTFNNMTYGEAFYKPMIDVIDYLNENDFNVYVVSGSDRFICRSLIVDTINVACDHIIGMDVRIEATEQGDTAGVNYQFKTTDELIRTDELLIKNLKFNKVAQIAKEIGKQPVLSFGNSGGDQSMHLYTITDNPHPAEAFMLVADDAERDYAVLSKADPLKKQWSDLGFHVVSMKNDFKTIYGENVTKKVA